MIISFAVLKLFRLFRPEPTGASAAPNNRRRGKRTNHDRRPGSGRPDIYWLSRPGNGTEKSARRAYARTAASHSPDQQIFPDWDNEKVKSDNRYDGCL